jgi:hypothetical protein
MMKTLKVIVVPLWIAAFAAVACIKKSLADEEHPPMQYTHLNNLEVKATEYSHLDIDGNGTVDFTFHTQLVGDPVLREDRRQFMVGSKVETSLLTNKDDESLKLKSGDRIGTKHEGYNWFEISSVILAEKVIPAEGNIFWRGVYKSANHHYLPVQVAKNGNVYHGWIQLSFSTDNERLILHKAAICTQSNTDVIAGY